MKKVLPFLVLLFIASYSYSQTKAVLIYSADTMTIGKFYKFPESNPDYKTFYIQLLGYSQIPQVDYRHGNIYKYSRNASSPFIMFFQNSYNICGFPFNTLAFGYVDNFALSRQDTGLKLGISHPPECEPYSSIFVRNGQSTTVPFPAAFMAMSFAIAIDPTDDAVMYAGHHSNVSPQYNFYKSTNRGANWTGIDSLPVSYNSFLKVVPFNSNVLLHARGGGLFVSTNGGYDFFNTGITSEVKQIEFDNHDKTVYAVGNGIFKSSDNGISWGRIHDSSFNHIEIDPLENDILYGGKADGLYRSTNKGVNWVLYNNSFSPSKNVIGLVKNPDSGDTLYVTTGKAVYKVFGPSLDDSSAAYFPLKVGNSYTYRWDNILQTGYYRTKITKDSIINGYRYYFFNGEYLNGWYRFDTAASKILKFSAAPCPGYVQDELIDSIGSKVGNQINSQCGIFSIWRCTDTSEVDIFGASRKSKRFLRDGLIQQYTRYTKGIGITQFSTGEPPPPNFFVNLKGCVIDGVLYGDTAAYDRSITGRVTYSGSGQNVTSGKVHLIKLDSNSGNVVILDSAEIRPNGYFFIPNPSPETSYVMAYQDDEFDFVPTYHPSTILWENAVRVYASSNITGINISVYPVDSSANNGMFRGVTYSTRSSLNGIVPGAHIYARVGNSFKNFGASDNTGMYSIGNLPYGNYKLISNRLGYMTDSLSVKFSHGVIWDSLNFYMQPLFTNIERIADLRPEKFRLLQNYPNPFNPVTRIVYHIPEKSFATVKVYDIAGRLISKLVEGELLAGEYAITFNAESLASGIYLYTLETESFKETRRMLLIK
jgi:hypothetical protein